jgi:transcriptional regulator of arginine metabolism
MKNKNTRLEVMKMIISSQEISSQEELRQEMDKAGFSLTQATMSRDLRLLKVAKTINGNGKYVYVLPEQPAYRKVSEGQFTAAALQRQGALSVKFSGNIAVIHTLPGHAGAIAYDIDNKRFKEILGTIAGDDTIFVVMTEETDRGVLLKRLAQVLPGMEE